MYWYVKQQIFPASCETNALPGNCHSSLVIQIVCVICWKRKVFLDLVGNKNTILEMILGIIVSFTRCTLAYAVGGRTRIDAKQKQPKT